jgi:hypothetical protein
MIPKINNTLMDIRLSRPCVDDPTRYIAECHFGKRVVIENLCDLLRSAGAKGLKCSCKINMKALMKKLFGKNIYNKYHNHDNMIICNHERLQGFIYQKIKIYMMQVVPKTRGYF